MAFPLAESARAGGFRSLRTVSCGGPVNVPTEGGPRSIALTSPCGRRSSRGIADDGGGGGQTPLAAANRHDGREQRGSHTDSGPKVRRCQSHGKASSNVGWPGRRKNALVLAIGWWVRGVPNQGKAVGQPSTIGFARLAPTLNTAL